MARALDTGLCLLVSHEPETGQIAVEAVYRSAEVAGATLPDIAQPGRPLDEREQEAVTQAIRSRRQVIRRQDNTSLPDRDRQALNEAGIAAQLILPMVARDRVVGCVVWIETRPARSFSGEDLRLAQTLTAQAAIAIENARLYRQARRQVKEQGLLRRVAVGLSIMGDTASLIKQLAAEILYALDDAEAVHILMKGDRPMRASAQPDRLPSRHLRC